MSTLRDPQRSSGFERNESWSEYCVNHGCNRSKLHKNQVPEIENLSAPCNDMSSVTSEVLFYYEASPLSSGKFLQRVYELRKKNRYFSRRKKKKKNQEPRIVCDGLFVMKLNELLGRHIQEIK